MQYTIQTIEKQHYVVFPNHLAATCWHAHNNLSVKFHDLGHGRFGFLISEILADGFFMPTEKTISAVAANYGH